MTKTAKVCGEPGEFFRVYPNHPHSSRVSS